MWIDLAYWSPDLVGIEQLWESTQRDVLAVGGVEDEHKMKKKCVEGGKWQASQSKLCPWLYFCNVFSREPCILIRRWVPQAGVPPFPECCQAYSRCSGAIYRMSTETIELLKLTRSLDSVQTWDSFRRGRKNLQWIKMSLRNDFGILLLTSGLGYEKEGVGRVKRGNWY